MQTISKLDYKNTDVLRHGDNHLANGFGLGVVAKLDLVELCHSIDQHCNFSTEVFFELLQRIVGIFDRVMQQGGCERYRADAELSKNLSHCERMRYVWLAALSQLLAVCEFRGHERTLNDRNVALWVIKLGDSRDFAERGCVSSVFRKQPRKHAFQAADACRRGWIAHDLLL